MAIGVWPEVQTGETAELAVVRPKLIGAKRWVTQVEVPPNQAENCQLGSFANGRAGWALGAAHKGSANLPGVRRDLLGRKRWSAQS